MTPKAQNSAPKSIKLRVERRGIVIYGPVRPTISDLRNLLDDLLREGASFSDVVEIE